MKISSFYRGILQTVNLQPELDDYGKIHESIQKDVAFKGTNLWILIFAIVVASIGLNMNSTAVIIGAMLISPLMGPINGMGYSIATYNFDMLRRAIKNFSYAVIGSLVASTIYFAISPISTAHSELLARTSPTIYDVLIALFGGFAGIVAISSKNKGNVIPGVAIATALMPPLCTAGYGLATAQFYFFFGALYLFSINTVFIALAAMLISKMLQFPIRSQISEKQKQTVTKIISLLTFIILIPSVYFGYILVQKERFIKNANNYVKNLSFFNGNYLLRNDIDADSRTIRLVYGGNGLSEENQNTIKQKTEDFSIKDATVVIQQGLSFDEITSKNSELENMRIEMNQVNMLLKDREKHIDSLYKRPLMGKDILCELKDIYPQVTKCTFADSYSFKDTINNPDQKILVILEISHKELDDNDKEKVIKWMKTRLKSKNVKVYFE